MISAGFPAMPPAMPETEAMRTNVPKEGGVVWPRGWK